MDIKNQKLKIRCNNCNQKIILTFHTQKCPKCNLAFDEEKVHQIFYNYESQLVNSNSHKAANGLNTASSFAKGSGEFFENIGCALTLIPLAIIGIVIILSFL